MTAAPYLLGRRGPGRAVIVGDPGGSGTTDGGFVEQPVVTTTAAGNTTINGKVKPGSFGKFVLPLATIQAGRQYTFRYTPHFSQLAQQGKLAMVGFGLKANNDFHIAGLRGDGSTGIHKYKVYGTPPNGWNKDTGHTTSDDGAAAAGTQAGPNYIRLIVSADGTTYTFKTSTDGSTWNTEYSGAAPSPFSNVSSVLTFGIALWFNNADAGPFSIDIDQFADIVSAPLDALSPTLAYSLSRDLLSSFSGNSRFTNSSGAVSQLNDQSGNARNASQGTAANRPTVSTAGPNSRTCADFDGTNDALDAAGVALSQLIAAGSGFFIASVLIDTFPTDNATSYGNSGVFMDAGVFAGLTLRSNGGSPLAYAYNWDGNEDKAQASIAASTAYVLTWRHEGGNLYVGVNGVESAATASGNTQTLTGQLRVGYSGAGAFMDGKLFECAFFSTVPSSGDRTTLIDNFKNWIGA
jgi:hypothetical protein